MNKQRFNETWKEVAKRWENGEIVWSAELGGLGPGYEQCIQTLLFEILVKFPKDVKRITLDRFKSVADPITDELDKKYKFSGAQVGMARSVAYQFIKYGYAEMMNKLDADCLIQVRKDFP